VPHTREGQHQHWPKRSQGGKVVVAFLCAYCHNRIDNGDWGNQVFRGMGPRINAIYRAWDIHNNTLIQRVIDPPWWEQGNGTNDSGRGNQDLSHAAGVLTGDVRNGESDVGILPEPSSGHGGLPGPAEHQIEVRGSDGGKEELDAHIPDAGTGSDCMGRLGSASSLPVRFVPPHPEGSLVEVAEAGSRTEPLTFDDWAEQTRTLAVSYRNIPWTFGAWLIEGEDRFGDVVWQVIDQELKIDHGTVANWMTTVRLWPKPCRHEDASYTLHALLNATRRKDPELADRLLAEAVAEGKTSAEVRALLSGPVEVCRCPICGKDHRP
jgi:hypothetical protein